MTTNNWIDIAAEHWEGDLAVLDTLHAAGLCRKHKPKPETLHDKQLVMSIAYDRDVTAEEAVEHILSRPWGNSAWKARAREYALGRFGAEALKAVPLPSALTPPAIGILSGLLSSEQVHEYTRHFQDSHSLYIALSGDGAHALDWLTMQEADLDVRYLVNVVEADIAVVNVLVNGAPASELIEAFDRRMASAKPDSHVAGFEVAIAALVTSARVEPNEERYVELLQAAQYLADRHTPTSVPPYGPVATWTLDQLIDWVRETGQNALYAWLCLLPRTIEDQEELFTWALLDFYDDLSGHVSTLDMFRRFGVPDPTVARKVARTLAERELPLVPYMVTAHTLEQLKFWVAFSIEDAENMADATRLAENVGMFVTTTANKWSHEDIEAALMVDTFDGDWRTLGRLIAMTKWAAGNSSALEGIAARLTLPALTMIAKSGQCDELLEAALHVQARHASPTVLAIMEEEPNMELGTALMTAVCLQD